MKQQAVQKRNLKSNLNSPS